MKPYKVYYIHRKDTDAVIGDLDIKNDKICKIGRRWIQGANTVEEISRALFDSIKSMSFLMEQGQ